MSEALRRANKAVLALVSKRNAEIAGRPDDGSNYDEFDVMVTAENNRAAILAFLDEENAGMVERMARATIAVRYADQRSAEFHRVVWEHQGHRTCEEARAILRALYVLASAPDADGNAPSWLGASPAGSGRT